MSVPAKIRKLDPVVVNRIAAGEIIQRPANALKELIENSLDAKATNVQIVTKEGGMKFLQIQDNGTGIRKEDMEIVCERFTTSKLQNFEDLRSISTFGFRGEALASISHVALLTITTKTMEEKCAYKATYIDSLLKEPLKSCAGNQGTTITIENLFYNVATRRKALSNTSEEFTKITEVVMRYAVHNPKVGFVLKKYGETVPQIRTPHNSTKMNNVRILYGNPVARELLEIEFEDDNYKFKMHALITNPNYTSKRMVFLLFINNRLVESSSIKKMLEEIYSIYLPKKTHPWCYISLEISPFNVDVNIHPTKHEVRFLHEDSIIEKIKFALDEKLANNSASRTFYLQARLPKVDITKETLKEILPEYDSNPEKTKKIHQRELIRTDASDQKLDKFNFTSHIKDNLAKKDNNKGQNVQTDVSEPKKKTQKDEIIDSAIKNISTDNNLVDKIQKEDSHKRVLPIKQTEELKETADVSNNKIDYLNAITDNEVAPASSKIVTSASHDMITSKENMISINSDTNCKDVLIMSDSESDDSNNEAEQDIDKFNDEIADKARKRVYQYFGNKEIDKDKTTDLQKINPDVKIDAEKNKPNEKLPISNVNCTTTIDKIIEESDTISQEFKSYSVNNFRREIKLTSILQLRKEIEDNYHRGLREILSNLTFIGCIDQTSALIQSGVNLYICNTKKLTEELFYEIMLYDFANHGVIKFSEPISLYDLALLGLETEEAGWTEEDGPKEELATSVKELLIEKADMMKEYFSIVIDKQGNLKSLPILLDKYFPYEVGLPLYILRLSTEVNWTAEQPCFQNICRETAKYFSDINPLHNTHDWKHITEHILYPAMRESLLPPKHFAHDSTILQIASLPDLYKVFERC